MLVGLCSPTEDTTPSTFGHMLSMLFQWFNATAYLPNDKTGQALEKLKSEYLPQWLRKVYSSHGEIFVNCLLPNPPDYAKVIYLESFCLKKSQKMRKSIKIFSSNYRVSLKQTIFNNLLPLLTVKSRAVDRSTIQFWNFLAKGHST